MAPTVLEFPDVLEQLAIIKAESQAIDFATREGYELGTQKIKRCIAIRGSLESKRVELKAPALQWGRDVDGKAKELLGLIEDIEKPLRERKLAVDKAEEARKREEERKAREAEEARLRAEREANERERRLLDERKAELEKLESQWKKNHGIEDEAPAPAPAPAAPAYTGPPRRSAPPQPVTAGAGLSGGEVVRESTWPWPLNRVVAQGMSVHVDPVGGAVQARIISAKAGMVPAGSFNGPSTWTGTGNTAEQALDIAFERWRRNTNA